jgi:hypothetical protein
MVRQCGLYLQRATQVSSRSSLHFFTYFTVENAVSARLLMSQPPQQDHGTFPKLIRFLIGSVLNISMIFVLMEIPGKE